MIFSSRFIGGFVLDTDLFFLDISRWKLRNSVKDSVQATKGNSDFPGEG